MFGIGKKVVAETNEKEFRGFVAAYIAVRKLKVAAQVTEYTESSDFISVKLKCSNRSIMIGPEGKTVSNMVTKLAEHFDKKIKVDVV